MENLATWRKLYTLRYCPITLIQAVFSAGTIYLLTAVHAGSGIRVAQKELCRSLEQVALVMQYLKEIGKSWQCATNIAGILKNLMHEQLDPLLERKMIPMSSSFNGALQVPVFIANDDEDAGTTLSRSSSKGHVRRHSSSSKINKYRRQSHSRNQSAGPPPISTSPTIMISPVQDLTSTPYAHSSSPARSVTAPIAIQSRSQSATTFSSSPSSLGLSDPWLVQPNGTPSPNSSPVFSPNFSSTSFEHREFQGYPQPITYGQPIYSGNGHGTNLFSGQGSLAANSKRGASHPPAHNYPGKELSGFFGMLGGQTLPQTPYVGFNLSDTIPSFEESSTSSDHGFTPNSPFGSRFPSHTPSLLSVDSSSSAIDNDTNMDDSSSWDVWAQTFD